MSGFHYGYLPAKNFVEQLPNNEERSNEIALIQEDFSRLNDGNIYNRVSRSKFIADCLTRGMSRDEAVAAFKTVDTNESETVDLYQYMLIRLITTNWVADRDSSTPLMDVRHKLIFNIYDSNGDGYLQTNELKRLLRDLAAGESHLTYLCEKMHVLEGCNFTFEQFKVGAQNYFDAHQLQTKDLLKPFHVAQQVVYSRYVAVAQSMATIPGQISTFNDHDASDPPSSIGLMHQTSTPIGSSADMGAGCIIDEQLLSSSDQRGLLVDRSMPVYSLANNIVENTRVLCERIRYEVFDVSDSEWLTNGAALNKMTGTTDITVQQDMIVQLSNRCKEILRFQPVMVEPPKPCKVFGDIHGQFRDLLLLFREFGFPSTRAGGDIDVCAYVFNGDFIDRGEHQLEVVTLLFALKVAYPSRVFLLRGNHEFRDIMLGEGNNPFRSMVGRTFANNDNGTSIFELIHGVFEWLPISALIAHSILVLHGGIGDGTWDLENLRNIVRPVENLSYFVIRDCLWSDPVDADETMARGVHPNPRGGKTVCFSVDTTKAFCEKNNIQVVIRSHQFVPEGYRIMHAGRLVTVFSARNYFNRESNDSAVIIIADDEEGNIRIRPKRLLQRVNDDGDEDDFDF